MLPFSASPKRCINVTALWGDRYVGLECLTCIFANLTSLRMPLGSRIAPGTEPSF
jgi:hypothetical protein